jgi:hypothetical protein
LAALIADTMAGHDPVFKLTLPSAVAIGRVSKSMQNVPLLAGARRG